MAWHSQNQAVKKNVSGRVYFGTVQQSTNILQLKRVSEGVAGY